MGEEPDEPNNALDAQPYHARKIRFHNGNMECWEGPHPYTQGMMKH
jgi:hypothetical protein